MDRFPEGRRIVEADLAEVDNVAVLFGFVPDQCFCVSCRCQAHEEPPIQMHGIERNGLVVIVIQQGLDLVELA